MPDLYTPADALIWQASHRLIVLCEPPDRRRLASITVRTPRGEGANVVEVQRLFRLDGKHDERTIPAEFLEACRQLRARLAELVGGGLASSLTVVAEAQYPVAAALHQCVERGWQWFFEPPNREHPAAGVLVVMDTFTEDTEATSVSGAIGVGHWPAKAPDLFVTLVARMAAVSAT